jgi:hypothetical protein
MDRPLALRMAPFVLAGILLCGASLGAATAAAASRAQEGLYRVELIDDHGVPLHVYDHRSRSWAMGHAGQRYRIRVHNLSSRRIEAVVSVDGRDALDGRTAQTAKPGYLVAPYSSVTVEGFRLSLHEVAAFRFGTVDASYAAQMGDDRHVGVVGVAVFAEKAAPPPVVRRPEPHRHCEETGAAPRGAGPSGAAAGPAPATRSRSAAGADAAAAAAGERPGLGTTFGERHHAPVVQVHFERAAPAYPDAVLALRYNDRRGLLAMGIDVDGYRWRHGYDARLRETAQPFADMPRGFAVPPAGWRP